MDTVLLTVTDTAARLRIGRSTLYVLLRSGALPSLKVGRLRRIAESDLAAFVQRLKEG